MPETNIRDMLASQMKTKNQLAYERIKTDIVQGYYKPGSRLLIREVAEAFGISETPIREALKTLEAEGLVNNTPHVGYVITVPIFKDSVQIFQVRQLLEGEATRLSANNMAEGAVENLKILLKEMRNTSPEDSTKLADLNYRFHEVIYSSCGNLVLYRLIQQVWAMVPRTRSIFSLVRDRIESSIQEHEDIFRYLEMRDGEKAREALIRHKQRSYDLLIHLAEEALPSTGSP
jgi:DNA-binding GntR family transcriptional regulator